MPGSYSSLPKSVAKSSAELRVKLSNAESSYDQAVEKRADARSREQVTKEAKQSARTHLVSVLKIELFAAGARDTAVVSGVIELLDAEDAFERAVRAGDTATSRLEESTEESLNRIELVAEHAPRVARSLGNEIDNIEWEASGLESGADAARAEAQENRDAVADFQQQLSELRSGLEEVTAELTEARYFIDAAHDLRGERRKEMLSDLEETLESIHDLLNHIIYMNDKL